MPKQKGGTFVYDPNEMFKDHIHKLFATEDFVDIQTACKDAIRIIKPDFKGINNAAFADMCFNILTDEHEAMEVRWVMLTALDRAIAQYVQSDPVSFEDINSDENERITFLENGVPFAFNKTTINSLGKKENPLTRKELPSMVQHVATSSDALYKKYLAAAVIKDPVERAAAIYDLQVISKPSVVRTRRTKMYQ